MDGCNLWLRERKFPIPMRGNESAEMLVTSPPARVSDPHEG